MNKDDLPQTIGDGAKFPQMIGGSLGRLPSHNIIDMTDDNERERAMRLSSLDTLYALGICKMTTIVKLGDDIVSYHCGSQDPDIILVEGINAKNDWALRFFCATIPKQLTFSNVTSGGRIIIPDCIQELTLIDVSCEELILPQGLTHLDIMWKEKKPTAFKIRGT